MHRDLAKGIMRYIRTVIIMSSLPIDTIYRFMLINLQNLEIYCDSNFAITHNYNLFLYVS